MASSDPLVVCRIIGDVVDVFVPRMTMNVYYGPKHVTNGCNIKPSIATNPPRVTFTDHSNELYTLVMTDPDAPSPSEPSMREWVHWSVRNEILPYMAPRPPIGIHRYIMLLFQQKGHIGLVEQPMSRANFSTRAFAHQLDLGVPVSTVYFNAQKEPMNRKR
ncbi:hypothetical protein RHGRI_023828 [Rhododendron griersonianum]|uniref:MFT-like protein n=1 Tax=Rhododendron griersonianum TaxID=479676 RepID=A0AAV6J4W2_9ERIC|nr:hypothetical protein RHGRI_023828 [Rhododendron griersonianum]